MWEGVKEKQKMNFAERFEDLEIWKESRRLNKLIYLFIFGKLPRLLI